nr:hypothetical protein [Sphingomonas sp.]
MSAPHLAAEVRDEFYTTLWIAERFSDVFTDEIAHAHVRSGA